MKDRSGVAFFYEFNIWQRTESRDLQRGMFVLHRL
jgi:hypothetical protein